MSSPNDPFMKAVEGVQRVARPTPSGVGAPRLCAFRQRRDLDVRRCAVVSAAPEPKVKNERRRGVATRAPRPKAVVRGGETQDQPRGHRGQRPWSPCALHILGMTLHVDGLRWHDPDHAARSAPVVGAPSRSECYGVVALAHAIARVPRSWGGTRRRRVGIPGTRALARVAAHCTPSTAF